MSDFMTKNCGCESGGGCSTILWIILLLCLCGGNSCKDGCSDTNNCIWIILLLLCCGGCGGSCGGGCGF